MDFSNVKKISISAGDVKQIEINGVVVWKSGYKNWVPLSINADGSIYNNGLGYKESTRIRSGGEEGAHSGGVCTGFIRVNPGDVIRVGGCEFDATSNANAINASNNSFVNIGQLTSNYASGGYGIFAGEYLNYSWKSVVKESDGVWKWVVPPAASGVAYIRVTGYFSVGAGGKGKSLIVTINEEID